MLRICILLSIVLTCFLGALNADQKSEKKFKKRIFEKRTLISLIGPPSCGRSTQTRLIQRYGHQVIGAISIRDLLNHHSDTERKREILRLTRSGEVIPLSWIKKSLTTALDALHKTLPPGGIILLEGLPRNRTQARWLHDFLKRNPVYHLKAVIYLDLAFQTAFLREKGRMRCTFCKARLSLDRDSMEHKNYKDRAKKESKSVAHKDPLPPCPQCKSQTLVPLFHPTTSEKRLYAYAKTAEHLQNFYGGDFFILDAECDPLKICHKILTILFPEITQKTATPLYYQVTRPIKERMIDRERITLLP